MKRRSPKQTARPPFRTLRGWAIGVLMETHAIVECSEHGHIRDLGSWPHGWDEARILAEREPYAGATASECLAAIDEVMASVGDSCPEC